jgi:hypothetical protein
MDVNKDGELDVNELGVMQVGGKRPGGAGSKRASLLRNALYARLRGRPRRRSATMLRRTSLVPP